MDDAQENATSVPFLSPFPCASPLSHSPPLSSSKSSRGRQRSLEETIIVSVTSNIVQNQQMEGCTPLLMEVRLGNETLESLGCGERYNTCDGTVPSLSVKPSGIPDGDCKKADFSPLLSGSPFGLISSTTPTRSSKTGTGSNILSKGSGELLLGSEKAIDMSLEQESTRNILLFPVRKFSASLDFLVSDTRSSAGSDTKGKIIRESNPSAPSSSSHPIRPTDVNFITDGIASTVIKGRNGSTNPSGEVADRLLLLARRLSKQGGITPTVSEHHNEENMRACRKVEGGGPKMSGFDEADFEDTEKAAGSKMQTTLHSEDLNGIGDPPVAEVKYKGATCMSKCPKTVEEQLNEERLLRSDTARRLLMLSSILSGKCSLSEYDDV